jgi:hypothetical protein
MGACGGEGVGGQWIIGVTGFGVMFALVALSSSCAYVYGTRASPVLIMAADDAGRTNMWLSLVLLLSETNVNVASGCVRATNCY